MKIDNQALLDNDIIKPSFGATLWDNAKTAFEYSAYTTGAIPAVATGIIGAAILAPVGVCAPEVLCMGCINGGCASYLKGSALIGGVLVGVPGGLVGSLLVSVPLAISATYTRKYQTNTYINDALNTLFNPEIAKLANYRKELIDLIIKADSELNWFGVRSASSRFLMGRLNSNASLDEKWECLTDYMNGINHNQLLIR